MCHKFSEIHLDVKGSGRQKVRLAAQVFSRTISKAMEALFPEKHHQAEVIGIINDWYDQYIRSWIYF